MFRSDADRRAYLALLQRYQRWHGLELWAYCLMSNHVHFVAVPSKAEALGKAFRDLHTAYAGAWNAAQGLSGHLWQARFFSCPLDDSHLWAAVRYVERNPARAGLVVQAEDYTWSSAAAHCGLRLGYAPGAKLSACGGGRGLARLVTGGGRAANGGDSASNSHRAALRRWSLCEAA